MNTDRISQAGFLQARSDAKRASRPLVQAVEEAAAKLRFGILDDLFQAVRFLYTAPFNFTDLTEAAADSELVAVFQLKASKHANFIYCRELPMVCDHCNKPLRLADAHTCPDCGRTKLCPTCHPTEKHFAPNSPYHCNVKTMMKAKQHPIQQRKAG